MLILSLIAAGCAPNQPKADTPKININKPVAIFLNQVEELESLTEQRDILLDSSEEYTNPEIAKALSELGKKHAQSPQEAAEQKEKQLAILFSIYYTKDRHKELEKIHQDLLELQSSVNSHSGEHKAKVQQAVDDFVKLTAADIRSSNDVLSFISDAAPDLPKFSFIGVAEAANTNNCDCKEISRVRVSPTLIRITYRCVCKVTIKLVQNQVQIQQLQAKSKVSLKELQDLKAIADKQYPRDRTISTKHTPNPNLGKVTVDPRTGKRSVTDFLGNKTDVKGGQYAGSEITKKINGKEIKVKYDKDGFPDFNPFTAYQTKLQRKDWFQSDAKQFNMLNKELYTKMNSSPTLKKQIDNTFLSVLQNGNGRGNGATKVKSFLNGSPDAARLLTQEDIKRLIKGKGVTPQTWNRINSDLSLKDQLLKTNENWIKSGRDPVGYLWNHNQNPGVMQLVNHKVHTAAPHTGGRTIWGGGQYYR